MRATVTAERSECDLDDQDDDDVLLLLIMATASLMMIYFHEDCLGEAFEVIRPRMDWNHHAEYLLLEGQFTQYYRMTHSSFEELLRLIAPQLQVDELQSSRRTSGHKPSTPASKLQACLSWLGGGNYQHVRVIAGWSKTSFYRYIYSVINAINSCSNLAPHFPSTPEELSLAAAGFAERSECGVFVRCVGAIDGWLCPIQVPRKDECGKVDSFFSGHYQRYGLNVQACVDHNSRFTAFSVNNPGGTNDSIAFKRWSLRRVLSQLNGAYYVVADNAYTQSTYIMTPYNKIQLDERQDRDSYNFFLSQLRIRVEMAFGLLVNKWRILKSELSCKLSNCPPIISACVRLHNFCVARRLNLKNPDAEREIRRELRSLNASSDSHYPQTQSNLDDDEAVDIDMDDNTGEILGEVFRSSLVDEISRLNMHRPARNIERRRHQEN